MIDLHSHILPGIDDGAPDMDASLAMARAAVEDGVRTMVATPHVNTEYEFGFEQIGRLVGELNIALARAELPLAVLPGAEVAVSRLGDIAPEQLRSLTLGGGDAVLVESPYVSAVAFLENVLFDLQLAGFRPVLAHPERSPLFQRDVDRLARLVQRGMLCSSNVGSLRGLFGRTVQRFALELLGRRLVHNISSDAHDAVRRSPRLSHALDAADPHFPGISAHSEWFVEQAPRAILTGERLPPQPHIPRRRRRWRHRLRRSRRRRRSR